MRRPRGLVFLVPIATLILLFFWILPPSSTSAYNSGLYKSLFNTSASQNSTSSLSPAKGEGKHNAVIFMLVSPSRLHQALLALRSTEDRFNRRLKYPYVLFFVESELKAQPLSDDDKQKVEWVTEGRATFATVPPEMWDVPSFLDPAKVEHSLRDIGFSLGYRAMCRFYSGFFYKHPALAAYDWLWRLDTDIEFHCDTPYDPVDVIVEKRAKYGFVQINADVEWVQPGLAANVSQFMHENREELRHLGGNEEFVWDGYDGVQKALRGQASNFEWTKLCMYNNFEISHRSLWSSPLYTKFFEFLDQAGGFFYERWSDSPIHSFALAMLLKTDEVVQFRDLGYQHQGWSFECPAHLDRCTCKREGELKDFDDNGDKWFRPRQ